MKWQKRSACFVWISLLVYLGVSAVGCAVPREAKRVSFRQGSRDLYSSSSGAAAQMAKGPLDHYLLLKPKKNSKPGKETVAFAVAPYHLWSPFRIEVAAGIFDGDLSKIGAGQACLELDERDSDPLVFYNICLRNSRLGGLNIFSFNAGAGQQNFAGSEVEFALEADGDNLLFEARPRGFPGSWTQIHSIPFANQTEPLVPSIGSFRTDKGAKIGFDEVRIIANGDDPDPLTPEREVVETIWDSVIAFLDAAYAVDGFAGDFINSATDIADGRAAISAATVAAKALDDGKPKKKALKKLKTAKKEAKKAAGFVEKQKAEKSYYKLVTTMDALISAIMALEPDFGLPGSS